MPGIYFFAVTVAMLVVMTMFVRCAVRMAPCAEHHPDCHTDYQDARGKLEIGFGFCDIPLAAEAQADQRDHPDHGGVRQGGGQT